MKYLIIAIAAFGLIEQSALALPITTPCSNTDLGNGWTCVGGNNQYGVFPPVPQYSLGFVNLQSGDLLVLAVDTTSNSSPITVTDSAGNAWQQFAPGLQPDAIDGPGHGYSIFYVLNSNGAAAGDTVTVSVANGDFVSDFAISQFRNSGGPSLGIEPDIAYTVNGVGGTGPCPCPGGSQSITTQYAGDLILGAANQNASPASLSAGFVPVDAPPFSDCNLSVNPFCVFAATSQTTAGNVGWQWSDTDPNDANFSVLLAFRNANAAATVPEPRAAVLGVTGLIAILLIDLLRRRISCRRSAAIHPDCCSL
jgi:hypothetical protein